jgi:hypothetical protein
MEGDRFVLRSITDEIMYALMELSGQEYVDMYATAMKERIARERRARLREAAEAALPGRAVDELERALDADGLAESRVEDDDDEDTPEGVDDGVGRDDDALASLAGSDGSEVYDPSEDDEGGHARRAS